MIEISKLCKNFGNEKILYNMDIKIKEGSILGLVGTNGAGKSTLVRMITGILKPDSGNVKIDGNEVYENIEAKSKFFYIADEQFFVENSSIKKMKDYFKIFYPKFDEQRYKRLIEGFKLNETKNIKNFSKGMKKQASIILGICANTKYIICDETFDGLDPVMRNTVKKIFAKDMLERGLTPIIISHNLREIEDICDTIILLHKGEILLNNDIDNLKDDLHKVQIVFNEGQNIDDLKQLDIIKHSVLGSINTIIVRGNKDEIYIEINKINAKFSEVIGLSLEEVFIFETEAIGYETNNIIF